MISKLQRSALAASVVAGLSSPLLANSEEFTPCCTAAGCYPAPAGQCSVDFPSPASANEQAQAIDSMVQQQREEAVDESRQVIGQPADSAIAGCLDGIQSFSLNFNFGSLASAAMDQAKDILMDQACGFMDDYVNSMIGDVNEALGVFVDIATTVPGIEEGDGGDDNFFNWTPQGGFGGTMFDGSEGDAEDFDESRFDEMMDRLRERRERGVQGNLEDASQALEDRREQILGD